MQVCLDARGLVQQHGTGVATYAQGVADSLAAAGCRVERLTDAGPAPGRLRRWLAAIPPGARPARLAGPGLRASPDAFRTAQVYFDLHRRFMPLRDAGPPQLMHWTYPLPLRLLGVPNIYTVHDVIPLLHPGLSPVPAARLRRMLRGVASAAAHVVTVSEASRRSILDTLGWAPDRVTATLQSVDVQDVAPRWPAAAQARGLQPGGYFLCAGTIEPRKNIRRLIEAHRIGGTATPLVLAGPDGWRAAEELQGAGPGVIRIPWVERAELVGLMRGAKAVLMPSLAEGFGLPVAEAMALGVPALASNGGALAEVAGGAALLADPLDAGALAGALAALDTDAGLRAALSDRGRSRAAAFTPAAHARRLLAVYARVASRP